jgi:hypothetical protein
MIALRRPDLCGLGRSRNAVQGGAIRGCCSLPGPLAVVMSALVLLVVPGLGQADGYPWQTPGGHVAGPGYSPPRVTGSDWSNQRPDAAQPSFDYVLPHPDAVRASGVPTSPPGGASFAPSDGIPGYWEYPGNQPVPPLAAPPGSRGRHAAPGPWTGQGPQGYRFRGDAAVSDGLWQELPNAPGFRFRPLSPDELEHTGGTEGWRPLGRDDRRPAEPVGPGAYGYGSDSWFGKYYGDRP